MLLLINTYTCITYKSKNNEYGKQLTHQKPKKVKKKKWLLIAKD